MDRFRDEELTKILLLIFNSEIGIIASHDHKEALAEPEAEASSPEHGLQPPPPRGIISLAFFINKLLLKSNGTCLSGPRLIPRTNRRTISDSEAEVKIPYPPCISPTPKLSTKPINLAD